MSQVLKEGCTVPSTDKNILRTMCIHIAMNFIEMTEEDRQCLHAHYVQYSFLSFRWFYSESLPWRQGIYNRSHPLDKVCISSY